MAVTDETTHRFVPLDYVERAPDEMAARRGGVLHPHCAAGEPCATSAIGPFPPV